MICYFKTRPQVTGTQHVGVKPAEVLGLDSSKVSITRLADDRRSITAADGLANCSEPWGCKRVNSRLRVSMGKVDELADFAISMNKCLLA